MRSISVVMEAILHSAHQHVTHPAPSTAAFASDTNRTCSYHGRLRAPPWAASSRSCSSEVARTQNTAASIRALCHRSSRAGKQHRYHSPERSCCPAFHLDELAPAVRADPVVETRPLDGVTVTGAAKAIRHEPLASRTCVAAPMALARVAVATRQAACAAVDGSCR